MTKLDLSSQDLEFLQRQVTAQMELARKDPMTYGHRPHEGQERIHTATSPHVLLVAANRFGKSEGGMREVLWRARGDHPYKDVRLSEVIWCGFPDYKFYLRVTEKHFHRWCPKDWLIEYSKTEKYAKIRRVDGGVCEIHFLSYDQDRDSWQGAAVDFMWLDEEMPEDLYREAYARLIDSSGDILQTLTPVEGMGWLYDQVFTPALSFKHLPHAQRPIDLVEGALAEFDASRPYNVGRPLVPHLSYSQILRFASSIPDEDERAIRVFGQFKARSGLVYKQFHEDVHVIRRFDVPENWEVWGGVDPGYHGFALVILASSPEGRVYVIGEYFSQEEATSKRLENIWLTFWRALMPEELDEDIAREQLAGGLVCYVDTEDPQLVLELNLISNREQVPIVFVSLQQGKKARKAGITRVQQLLLQRPENARPPEVSRETPELGEPLCYVFDDLWSTWRLSAGDDVKIIQGSRLIWELNRYIWKRPPKGAPHPEDADERSAGGAHALAAYRYAVMARIEPPETEAPDPYQHMNERERRVWQHMKELDQAMR